MAEQPWFRVWARASLGSMDIGALTHMEEVVWWRLLMVTSVQEERWTVAINEHLARQCKVNVRQLATALNRLSDLGMVALADARVTTVKRQ